MQILKCTKKFDVISKRKGEKVEKNEISRVNSILRSSEIIEESGWLSGEHVRDPST